MTEFSVDIDTSCLKGCLGLLTTYSQAEIVDGGKHSSWVFS